MSRIGKSPIEIPAGVTVQVKDHVVTVKGPKGELSQEINPAITVEQEEIYWKLSVPTIQEKIVQCTASIVRLSRTW